jgi:hypothetical protein
MLGKKLKKLNVLNRLLLRQDAAELEIDNANISKIEDNDKPVSKYHKEDRAKFFDLLERELMSFCLGEKVLYTAENNELSTQASNFALKNIKDTNE